MDFLGDGGRDFLTEQQVQGKRLAKEIGIK